MAPTLVYFVLRKELLNFSEMATSSTIQILQSTEHKRSSMYQSFLGTILFILKYCRIFTYSQQSNTEIIIVQYCEF